MQAEWQPDVYRSKIKVGRGKHLQTLGTPMRGGGYLLMPEETLYLVERGSATLCLPNEDRVLSLAEVYSLCIPHVGLQDYQVYAQLKRAGYIVKRRGSGQTARAKSLPSLFTRIFRTVSQFFANLFISYRTFGPLITGQHSSYSKTLTHIVFLD